MVSRQLISVVAGIAVLGAVYWVASRPSESTLGQPRVESIGSHSSKVDGLDSIVDKTLDLTMDSEIENNSLDLSEPTDSNSLSVEPQQAASTPDGVAESIGQLWSQGRDKLLSQVYELHAEESLEPGWDEDALVIENNGAAREIFEAAFPEGLPAREISCTASICLVHHDDVLTKSGRAVLPLWIARSSQWKSQEHFLPITPHYSDTADNRATFLLFVRDFELNQLR